jgi:hypothetical protein
MIDANVIAHLWERMAMLYGHRWASSYGETDDGTWLRGLVGLTREQIGVGISRAIQSGEAWPPTLPQFRAWCEPTAADLGIPAFEDAYREACVGLRPHTDHTWSHPVVYHAAHSVGRYEFLHLNDDTLRRMFRRAYDVMVTRAKRGEALDIPVPKTLPPVPIRRTRATGERALTRIRQLLNMGDTHV